MVKKAKEYAKLAVEFNRDMLVFWALLFFTCVVGIIELLPQIKEQPISNIGLPGIDLRNEQTYISVIYFGLLGGMIFSILNSFRIYRDSKKLVLAGELGEDSKKYAEKNFTWIGRLILTRIDKPAEILVAIPIFVSFTLLYCVRIGLL